MVVTPSVVAVSSPQRLEAGGGNGGSDESPRCLYLSGRPQLKDYLKWMERHAAERHGEAELTQAWQDAASTVAVLGHQEAGIADDHPLGTLGAGYRPLLKELLRDPMIQGGFNTVPTDIQMVELDRLVVYQKHIDLSHVPRIERALGSSPTAEQVFRTVLPADHRSPPARWSRAHGDKFVFVSPSNDLRYLGVMELEQRHLTAPGPGVLVGVVGIAVGFGSNFLNAIRTPNGRVILNNGSHRAYALRHLGVTHAPCIVQHAGSRDELMAIAPEEVRDTPDLFLAHPRPMLLKDYFDARLHVVTLVKATLHQVTVSFEVDENVLPAL